MARTVRPLTHASAMRVLLAQQEVPRALPVWRVNTKASLAVVRAFHVIMVAFRLHQVAAPARALDANYVRHMRPLTKAASTWDLVSARLGFTATLALG